MALGRTSKLPLFRIVVFPPSLPKGRRSVGPQDLDTLRAFFCSRFGEQARVPRLRITHPGHYTCLSQGSGDFTMASATIESVLQEDRLFGCAGHGEISTPLGEIGRAHV